jgi:hypothetical protein
VGRSVQASGLPVLTWSAPEPFRRIDAGVWDGDHHDGVPIHVLTHHVNEDDVPPGNSMFHTDVGECATAARASSGDRPVMVHGAGAADAEAVRDGGYGPFETGLDGPPQGPPPQPPGTSVVQGERSRATLAATGHC